MNIDRDSSIKADLTRISKHSAPNNSLKEEEDDEKRLTTTARQTVNVFIEEVSFDENEGEEEEEVENMDNVFDDLFDN